MAGDDFFREVYASNLEEQMAVIRDLIDRYNYVSIDTEFPGVVARPVGQFRTTAEYQYQNLRCNCDLLKIIQLGLTFSDENGNLPDEGPCTWQFNFAFNLDTDMYAQDSIELLQRSGIDFKKSMQYGIDVNHFAELLMVSGLVANEDVKYISFHSGFDFGYLLKLLVCEALPEDEATFFELMQLYFPSVYDIKYIIRGLPDLQGGLQDLGNTLGVKRIGPQHQAGSDSLLTCAVYFRMRNNHFPEGIPESDINILYGLGQSTQPPSSSSSSSSSTVQTQVHPSSIQIPTASSRHATPRSRVRALSFNSGSKDGASKDGERAKSSENNDRASTESGDKTRRSADK